MSVYPGSPTPVSAVAGSSYRVLKSNWKELPRSTRNQSKHIYFLSPYVRRGVRVQKPGQAVGFHLTAHLLEFHQFVAVIVVEGILTDDVFEVVD